MSFAAKLQRAREVLEQQGRLSVRALGRELGITGEELDELIDELVDVQRVAVRKGNVLVCAALQGVRGHGISGGQSWGTQYAFEHSAPGRLLNMVPLGGGAPASHRVAVALL